MDFTTFEHLVYIAAALFTICSIIVAMIVWIVRIEGKATAAKNGLTTTHETCQVALSKEVTERERLETETNERFGRRDDRMTRVEGKIDDYQATMHTDIGVLTGKVHELIGAVSMMKQGKKHR